MKSQAKSNEAPKPRRTQLTPLMGMAGLPQCKGIVLAQIKGKASHSSLTSFSYPLASTVGK